MALLGGFRADQLISQLNSEVDTNSRSAQKTIERLKKIGPKVIPRIIDALAMSDKGHTMVFVDILASYVDDKTLKYYLEGLADGGERVVSGTAWALSSSNNFNANALLEFFDDDEGKMVQRKRFAFDPLFSYKLNPFSVFYFGGHFGARNNITLGRQDLKFNDQSVFAKFQYLFRS